MVISSSLPSLSFYLAASLLFVIVLFFIALQAWGIFRLVMHTAKRQYQMTMPYLLQIAGYIIGVYFTWNDLMSGNDIDKDAKDRVWKGLFYVSTWGIIFLLVGLAIHRNKKVATHREV